MATPSKGIRKAHLVRMPLTLDARLRNVSGDRGWSINDTILMALDKGMEALDDKRTGRKAG